jgi:hypothetical protein
LGAAAVLLLLALGGCVSPARNDASYRDKAHQSAKAAGSEVATVQMVLGQLDRRRLPAAYADDILSNSEDALGSIETAFASVQPPDTDDADQLSDDASQALGDSQDAARDARIAARRGDAGGLADARTELADAARRLQDLQASTA